MLVNIMIALLGVSIFAMPWGFVISGMIGGILIVLIVSFISFKTAKILVDAQRMLYERCAFNAFNSLISIGMI
jgi:hypothetical protein